jgi:hypothetical protein
VSIFDGSDGSLLKTLGLPPSEAQGPEPGNNGSSLGWSYFFLSNVPDPPASPAGPCGTPGASGYLNPAKLRVSRARVLREDRRLDVLAPITSRARGADVAVTYQSDGRSDTFAAE